MTDREKAIVMAYTGATMLADDKFSIFHKYIEDICGRPIYTHELADEKVSQEIKEKSRDDFIKLCQEETYACDFIDRADAMTEIQMNARRYTIAKEIGGMRQVEWSDYLVSIKDALDILIKMPSVQQEPKTDVRECGSCKYSKDGHMAGTEECHECMWESKQEPKTGWIPVSEDLPDDGQEILFSTKTGRVHSGKYHDDDSANKWYSRKDKCRAWNNVVNAWMPLPEPYKESEVSE